MLTAFIGVFLREAWEKREEYSVREDYFCGEETMSHLWWKGSRLFSSA